METPLLTAVSVCASVCPDLELKAADLNRTLSRRDGTPEKSLKEMKEEIQAMLAEMRERQLGGKKSIAEEEMGYGDTHSHVHISFVFPPNTRNENDLGNNILKGETEDILSNNNGHSH